MSIEALNNESNYDLIEFDKDKTGSDGRRTYILLESGVYCDSCLENPRMKEFGLERIGFQVYQIAEEKLFNIDFKVAISSGNSIRIGFHNKNASARSYSDFFSEVENTATDMGAIGLAAFANQAAVIAAGSQFPAHLDSEYFRCMAECDKIEFELFKLLCYVICEFRADDTPGS